MKNVKKPKDIALLLCGFAFIINLSLFAHFDYSPKHIWPGRPTMYNESLPQFQKDSQTETTPMRDLLPTLEQNENVPSGTPSDNQESQTQAQFKDLPPPGNFIFEEDSVIVEGQSLKLPGNPELKSTAPQDPKQIDVSPLTHPWVTGINDIMGCKSVYEKPDDNSVDVYFVADGIARHGNNWFQRKNDAFELSKLVLGAENYQKSLTSENLRIGFVQREKTRIIHNLTSLVDSVKEQYPDAIVTTEKFAGLNLKEQAQWYANQDLIIAAHGAGLINLAFAHECVAVFQLHCEGYYINFYFDHLVENIGGIMLDYYDGDETTKHIIGTVSERYLARKNNISIDKEVLLENINRMIMAREKCLKEK
eukprot:Awhi_evm1s15486